MKKNYWYTQKMLFRTTLFGKEYMWMEDVDGTVYLAKLDEHGNPSIPLV